MRIAPPGGGLRRSAATIAIAALTALAGCGGRTATQTPGPSAEPSLATPRPNPSSPEVTSMPTLSVTLTSAAFAEGGMIAPLYTCDGEDVSPPLAWTDVPASALSLAIIVDDPDARGFVHWVVYAIDPAAGALDEGASGGPGSFREGRNDFGRTGYGGPCPPSGTHRYVFRLLALDTVPSFATAPSAADVLAAAAGHILAETTLTGNYSRRA